MFYMTGDARAQRHVHAAAAAHARALLPRQTIQTTPLPCCSAHQATHHRDDPLLRTPPKHQAQPHPQPPQQQPWQPQPCPRPPCAVAPCQPPWSAAAAASTNSSMLLKRSLMAARMAATLFIQAGNRQTTPAGPAHGAGERGEPHVWLTLVVGAYLSWENAVLL